MLKISLLFSIQTLRVNNSRILTIMNAKFSGYYFYMNLNIWGDFQICISVTLRARKAQIKHYQRYKKQSKLFHIKQRITVAFFSESSQKP